MTRIKSPKEIVGAKAKNPRLNMQIFAESNPGGSRGTCRELLRRGFIIIPGANICPIKTELKAGGRGE